MTHQGEEHPDGRPPLRETSDTESMPLVETSALGDGDAVLTYEAVRDI